MIRIDWSDVAISAEERSRAEAHFENLSLGDNGTLAVRKRRGGYEAVFTAALGARATAMRLHGGDDIGELVERARELLSIVAHEAGRIESSDMR